MDKDGILRVPESGTPGTPTTGSVKRWIKRACSPADLAHSRDIIGLWISITKQTDLILDSDSQSFFLVWPSLDYVSAILVSSVSSVLSVGFKPSQRYVSMRMIIPAMHDVFPMSDFPQ